MFLHIDDKNKNRVAAWEDNGGKITYGELVEFSEEMMRVAPTRTLAFCLCENSIGSLAGYVAMMSAGIVPLLLNHELEKSLLHKLLDIYQPNFLWMPDDMDSTGEIILHQYGYQLVAYAGDEKNLAPQLALLLTTSGSTGSPKLVRQSYDNINANAASIAQYLELDETERPITMLPMNYTYGLSVINSHLLLGATILMTDINYAQRGFWDFFKENQATSIVGVPFTYEILKKLRIFRMELSSLRYMTQAGGKLIPELHKEFAEYAKEKKIRFYVMYGQTEATARMSYLPYEKSLEKYGSMGIAIPGGCFHLIDTEGKEICEPHVTGELV